ncbi:hypothetical protein FF100_22185 [Methylobacterium terricola]|uniref:Uncharacterized protein n=1 Tax=Methylobacterium terricola TaxID=2583531 RepID=A0A5C4LC98_9HYPH|nr:hypothetical protein [Methylobacterium terricola]TNC10863.1 hypothetical protein FF100_22185 [Methylobacterium terricola]
MREFNIAPAEADVIKRIHCLIHRYMTLPRPFDLGPLPAFTNLTAIQLALWDDGPELKIAKSGRKTGAVRYKLTIEAYFQPNQPLNKRQYVFKRNIPLRAANPFLTLIDKQKAKGTITDSYHKNLGDTVLALPLPDRDQFMFGQIWENNEGWRYFEDQFVAVKMPKGDDPAVAIIFNEGTELMTEQMNSHFASGKMTHSAFIDLS